MKKTLWLYVIALFVTGIFISCEEVSEESEYANWADRNQRFIESLADSVETHPDRWFALKAYDLPADDEDNLSATKDVNDYVYYQIEEEGTGTTSPIATDSIRCNYRVWLINDKLIDQSYRGEILDPSISVPAKFYMSNIIKGWTTALQQMNQGDVWMVYIPYTLGYGTSASGDVPGYSALKCRINLTDFSPIGSNMPNWQ